MFLKKPDILSMKGMKTCLKNSLNLEYSTAMIVMLPVTDFAVLDVNLPFY